MQAVGARRGVPAARVGLAWLLGRADNVLLIPGTSSVAHLEENMAVADLELTDEDLAELTEASASATVTGDRYPEAMQRMIDR